jgi:hypothetical protein
MMTDFSMFHGAIQASLYEFIAFWTVHRLKRAGRAIG